MVMGLSDSLQVSYQTCCKVVLTRLIQSCYNNIVTVLSCQPCDNLVSSISISESSRQPCNKSGASVRLVTSSQQVVFAIIIPSYQEASEQLVVVTKVVRFLHVWK